ncbi:DUF4832 domain-containing protein [uncultured Amnibacterium sp.]|uniref:DUF4832 domain-containing protein n=1 Tax=uncultured Amnibacterium sp. TaxID=1631851 RepID=UPI0035CBBD4E
MPSTERHRHTVRRKPPGRLLVLVGVVIGVLILSGTGIGIAVALGRATTSKTVQFTGISADIANPERGWFDQVDLVNDRDLASQRHDHVTLLHSYIRLDAYRDTAIPSSVLMQIGQGFAAVRSAGMKVIVRVAYNVGPYPNSQPDATVPQIERHIKQLEPVFKANTDVIESFEAGYIGAWGEWHTSTNHLDTSATAKATVLKAILAAYPANRSVALRYPSDIRTLVGASGDDGRIGNHEDCFLSTAPDDSGTWARNPRYSIGADKALIATIGRHGIVGGETCGVSPRTTCPTATHELAELHFTYLNRQFDPNALGKLQQQGCLGTIGTHLGYRFTLTTATFTPKVSPGGTMGLTFSIHNSGNAHLVNARPVYAVLAHGATVIPLRLNADPRTWAPGRTTTVAAQVTVPSDLAAGGYHLSLWLPDASERLQDRSAYSIRFADEGTWSASTGRNTLGVVVTVK